MLNKINSILNVAMWIVLRFMLKKLKTQCGYVEIIAIHAEGIQPNTQCGYTKGIMIHTDKTSVEQNTQVATCDVLRFIQNKLPKKSILNGLVFRFVLESMQLHKIYTVGNGVSYWRKLYENYMNLDSQCSYMTDLGKKHSSSLNKVYSILTNFL